MSTLGTLRDCFLPRAIRTAERSHPSCTPGTAEQSRRPAARIRSRQRRSEKLPSGRSLRSLLASYELQEHVIADIPQDWPTRKRAIQLFQPRQNPGIFPCPRLDVRRRHEQPNGPARFQTKPWSKHLAGARNRRICHRNGRTAKPRSSVSQESSECFIQLSVQEKPHN